MLLIMVPFSICFANASGPSISSGSTLRLEVASARTCILSYVNSSLLQLLSRECLLAAAAAPQRRLQSTGRPLSDVCVCNAAAAAAAAATPKA